jgi:hypothetical protein
VLKSDNDSDLRMKPNKIMEKNAVKVLQQTIIEKMDEDES